MGFKSTIIWNGISQFGQSGIQFLSTIILARLLTPDDFGIIGMVNIFIILSQVMVDSEMGGALLRKKEVNNIDYSTLFFYNLGISILIYTILYFSAPIISNIYNRPQLIQIIRVLSICILIHAFRVVQKIMIFRDLAFRKYAVINLSSGLISLACAIIFAKNGYGYWALVYQQIITAGLNVIFMEMSNRFIPSLSFSLASFRYQFKFGISLLGSDIILAIANNISTNIVAKVTSLNTTGLYTQANKLTTFAQTSAGAILDQSVFPLLAKIDSKNKIDKIYNRLFLHSIIILLLFSLVLIIFPEPIIRLILGKDWIKAGGMLSILSFCTVPLICQVLGKNILKTLNKTHWVMKLSGVKSILLISTMLIGSHFGFTYILWSLVISQVLATTLWIVIIDRELNHSSFDRLALLYGAVIVMASAYLIFK